MALRSSPEGGGNEPPSCSPLHLIYPLLPLGWVKCQRRRFDPNPPSLDWLGVALTCLSPYSDLMSLTEIDHWIGKTLFVPPIIKLCQLTRQSQFAVARLFWFIAALDGFYRAETLFMSIIWGGLSIFMMLSATRRADSPTESFMFFRLLAITLLTFDLLKGFKAAIPTVRQPRRSVLPTGSTRFATISTISKTCPTLPLSTSIAARRASMAHRSGR